MKNKYNAKVHTYQGITFASKLEMQRYIYLADAQQRGEIFNLQTQVRYEILPPIKGTKTIHLKTKDKTKEYTIQRPVNYTADFVYNTPDGGTVVEDAKGSIYLTSRDFPLRKKLMRYFHNIDIRIVTKPNTPVAT